MRQAQKKERVNESKNLVVRIQIAYSPQKNTKLAPRIRKVCELHSTRSDEGSTVVMRHIVAVSANVKGRSEYN